MKHSLRECGRKLAAHVRARAHAEREMKRRSLFEKYIPEVALALGAILSLEAEKIEKPFYKALPTFVRFADEEPSPKDGGGGGGSNGAGAAPPPSTPPATQRAAKHEKTAKTTTSLTKPTKATKSTKVRGAKTRRAGKDAQLKLVE